MSVQTIVTEAPSILTSILFVYIYLLFNFYAYFTLSQFNWTYLSVFVLLNLIFFPLKISFNGFLCSWATGDLGVLKLYMSLDDQ